MSTLTVELKSLRELGRTSPDADHVEWRIRTRHGLTIARSLHAYASVEEAEREADEALSRLTSLVGEG